MVKLSFIVALVVGMLEVMPVSVYAQDEQPDQLKGGVIILGSDDDALPGDKTQEINVGGLVIVKIHDLGSEAVQNVKVDAGREYRQLGQVRGVGVANGKLLMGGGYTWCLMQAVSEAEKSTITVSYKSAPHAGGKQKSEKFTVEIAADSDE